MLCIVNTFNLKMLFLTKKKQILVEKNCHVLFVNYHTWKINEVALKEVKKKKKSSTTTNYMILFLS